MPGWIAVAPIPEPDEKAPCAVCGEVHAEGQHPVMQLLGAAGPPTKINSAVVLEVGDAPEHLVPFEVGSKVFYTDDRGITIGDCRFMLAQAVIAWE
jgi:hypothetical protein